MSHDRHAHDAASGARDEPPATQQVVSTQAATRMLLVVLCAWTFFLGLALFTQGVGLLSYGGGDDATERVLGAHLLILAPMYGLLAWRPVQYRLLAWTPWAGQLAIILPTLWDLAITGDRNFDDGTLIFIISAIFLGLLVYLRVSAHGPDWFLPGSNAELEDEDADLDDEDAPDEDSELEEDEENELDDEDDTGEEDDEPAPDAGRGRRYRRS